MKRIFNSNENDAEFNLGSDIKSEVYNALADIAFKNVQKAAEHGIDEDVVYVKLGDAIDWFLDRFFDEDYQE